MTSEVNVPRKRNIIITVLRLQILAPRSKRVVCILVEKSLETGQTETGLGRIKLYKNTKILTLISRGLLNLCSVDLIKVEP